MALSRLIPPSQLTDGGDADLGEPRLGGGSHAHISATGSSCTNSSSIPDRQPLAEIAEDLVRGVLADYRDERTISLLAISVSGGARTELAVGKSRLEWLEYLNTANSRTRITHFSLVEGPWGTYDVRMFAFASVPDSREAFAIVMDMWHDDLDWIRRKRDVPVRTAVATDDEEEEEAVTLH